MLFQASRKYIIRLTQMNLRLMAVLDGGKGAGERVSVVGVFVGKCLGGGIVSSLRFG